MKKIILVGVIHAQNLDGTILTRRVTRALEKILVQTELPVCLCSISSAELAGSPLKDEIRGNDYWITLEGLLLDKGISVHNLLSLSEVMKVRNIPVKNIEQLITLNYFQEIGLYQHMVTMLAEAPDFSIVVMPFAFAMVFRMLYDQSVFQIEEHWSDDVPPGKILIRNPVLLQEVIDRHNAITMLGEFLAKEKPKPDFIGTWSKVRQGEYQMYILQRDGEKVFGVITDRNGPATFSGTLSQAEGYSLLKFTKEYPMEVYQNTQAVPVPMRYEFESADDFVTEEGGMYAFDYQGPNTGVAFIQKV